MFRFATFGLIIVFVVVALGGRPASVTAQDDTPTPTPTTSPDCKPAALIKTLGTIKSVGDTQKDMDALLKLDDAIKAQDAACNGLSFKGTGEKSIGPMTLDSGTYLVHLVTKGFFIGTLKVLSGNCSISGIFGSSGIMYNISSGQADDGADVTIDSTGCRALILTSNVNASWTLAITLAS